MLTLKPSINYDIYIFDFTKSLVTKNVPHIYHAGHQIKDNK